LHVHAFGFWIAILGIWHTEQSIARAQASVHSWEPVEEIDRYCKLLAILKRVIHGHRHLCIQVSYILGILKRVI
jgi:hypothetical protein